MNWLQYPNGYDHELVVGVSRFESWFHRRYTGQRGPKYAKYAEAQCPVVIEVIRRGGCKLRCGQSEARLPVFKSPSKPGTHLSTHCSTDERLSRHCPAQE
ncbi:hypothetical protein TNCV_4528871 [Trichonephila clavipes]|nr:hypothetical protein TNCV_4528871 [Trichonephila clavipes]